MKLSTLVVALASLVSASPVDMTPYKPDSTVDADFGPFVKECVWLNPSQIVSADSMLRADCTRYYRISEDKTATSSFTDFWPAHGVLIAGGKTFTSSASILAVKQRLLPPNGNKAWWHLIEGASVLAEDARTKTINAKIVIQTTYTPGNCSQAHGNAAFTVAKDALGVADWTPHSGSLLVYNLTVNTIQSPTDEPCTLV